MNKSPRATARLSKTSLLLHTGCVMLMAMPAVAQDAPFVRDVAQRLNAQRAQHRLKALNYNKTLEKAAQAHAEWMARNQRMEHLQDAPRSLDEHRTCNQHPANRAINAGYFRWDDLFTVEPRPDGAVVHAKPAANQLVSEVIAKAANAGHPATHTATIVTGWMNSPGHRQAILTPSFREFGIGTACIGNDTYWCVVLGAPAK
ncbi:MAG: CAP domain-containing protein [Planctomycetia bacterium]